jgi:DNA polymerase I-like protein with 3'-5' exonuclease and polymerase domains
MLMSRDLLEVVVAAELSGDKVLSQEIIDEVDIHDTNRVAFNLGEGKPGRLIAKIFKFRLIYGGSAYSYAHDSDFTGVSSSEKFWQDVIDRYYAKYTGIAQLHKQLISDAQRNGRIIIPSGRFYPIEPTKTWRGLEWPITKIKNYPVQGYGADLVMLARLQASKLIREAGIEALLISTIHDSIVVDTPTKNVEQVAHILKESIETVPSLCKQVFNHNFKLPLTCEVQYGPNKKDMVDYKF